MTIQTKAIVDARERGFLICRDHWQATERAWRRECDSRGIPSIVVTISRRKGALYIDPPRAMRQEAVDVLWPLFREAAMGRAKYSDESFIYGCNRHYCQITLTRTDALTLAAKAALILRNMPVICPERRDA